MEILLKLFLIFISFNLAFLTLAFLRQWKNLVLFHTFQIPILILLTYLWYSEGLLDFLCNDLFQLTCRL